MAYAFGGHRPGARGRHPGSPSGPEPKGSGAYHKGLHYLGGSIDDTNRVKGARPESETSPQAVDRTSGKPSKGRHMKTGPPIKAFNKGGEVDGDGTPRVDHDEMP